MLERRFARRCLVLASFVAALLPMLGNPAEARHRHHHRHFAYHTRHFHHRLALHHRRGRHFSERRARGLAEIVIDTNSGRVLYAQNENTPWHPASLTKVMTLYLLFKELDAGRLHLDSRLTISAHAAAQAPTKLGLRPGQTIDVDDAIKAIVTRSANDIAVAVAENIGGSEANFAAMMTRQAHALGMTHTYYVNASGLPDNRQITTAADLTSLGRVIQERFPRYFHYFSLREFAYHGQEIRNHDHLLGRVPGVDGIKTGFICASGFNLLTSVHRDGRALIAVVLGGATAASRDRVMTALIDREIAKASTRRSTTRFAETSGKRKDSYESPRRTIPAAWAARAEALHPDVPVAPARPAYIASTPSADNAAIPTGSVRRVSFDGSTDRPQASTTTPSALHRVDRRTAAKRHEIVARISDAELAAAGIMVKPQDHDTAEPEPRAKPRALPPGWMIQIGATDDVAKAEALLARAKARRLSALDDAKPFTEKVKKGAATLYRARFAGLDADNAQAACRGLKRSGFACFAMKN